MISEEIFAIAIYVAILFSIGFASHKKNLSSSDFIIGSRQMNFFLTALAAHASDMSSWIFMAYPAVIFALGFYNIWTAIGLTVFMYLNWQYIAPKIRTESERYSSVTFSSYFESRYADTSGSIRIVTAIMLFIFYTIYISAGLQGLGLLIESLFPIPYWVGITIGILIVVPYLFIGGYLTLAWTDLFQGLFLLLVIVAVPLYILPEIGGFTQISNVMTAKGKSFSLLPTKSFGGVLDILFIMSSWGLGYFGQPHIITKFMGIRDVKNMYKSKYVGITWQIIALSFSTIIGLIAIAYFQKGIDDSQLIFITMVQKFFSPFIAAFILCAILGVTITSMDSQILVLASSLAEDFYKKIFRKTATSKELLIVSRLSIFIVGIIAYLIAFKQNHSIFQLVSYAWFGLGASFGPLLIFSLYSRKSNKYGAWAGVITGGVIAAIWPLINQYITINIPTLIPGFLLSAFAIWLGSYLTYEKTLEH